jgi:hypothetical protein
MTSVIQSEVIRATLVCTLAALAGAGALACTRSEAAEPAAALEAPAPDAGAGAKGPVMVASGVAVGYRLTDATKAPYKVGLPKELNVAGAVYWGLFKICVADTGEVKGVGVMRSTGQPALLDGPWIQTMKTWRYKPYSVNGRPVPFCHPLRMQVNAVSK